MIGPDGLPVNPVSEVKDWVDGIGRDGGTITPPSVVLANDFMAVLKTKSYYSKIVYFLPLLGSNLSAALVPLIDRLRVGSPTNNGFVASDFKEELGLQGDGTKYLNTRILPSQLSTSGNGGLGYWENNIKFLLGLVEPMGCYGNPSGSQRYVLQLSAPPNSSKRHFSWGESANGTTYPSAATNGHYYGFRSSATNRRLAFNGDVIASSSVSDTPTGLSNLPIFILGKNAAGGVDIIDPWPGRCALAYMTNGDLQDAEAFYFNLLLRDMLIKPLGRLRW